MTNVASRPTNQSGGDTRIVPKGGAGYNENRNKLVELLGTPISAVFLAAKRNFATITFHNDVMARVTLAGLVDTTQPSRFNSASIEDLHEHFRKLLLSGVVTRAQASPEVSGYDIDLVIDGVEYRVRFAVIAVL